MGLSWSPWVAQSVGWAILLFKQEEEEDLFHIPSDIKQLPQYVRIRSGGFITLFYDNILAVGVDANAMEKINRRLPPMPADGEAI